MRRLQFKLCVFVNYIWDYKVFYSMVQLGWNPYTVESELNIGKGQGGPLIVKPQTTNQCIMCMSVQCVLGTQAEPENEAMSIAYLQFWHLFTPILHECEKWIEMIRMFILTFWVSSWALILFLNCIIGLLGFILFTFSKQSIIVY